MALKVAIFSYATPVNEYWYGPVSHSVGRMQFSGIVSRHKLRSQEISHELARLSEKANVFKENVDLSFTILTPSVLVRLVCSMSE